VALYPDQIGNEASEAVPIDILSSKKEKFWYDQRALLLRNESVEDAATNMTRA
jgi:hypothetical protein